jgi:hypothetical protein
LISFLGHTQSPGFKINRWRYHSTKCDFLDCGFEDDREVTSLPT